MFRFAFQFTVTEVGYFFLGHFSAMFVAKLFSELQTLDYGLPEFIWTVEFQIFLFCLSCLLTLRILKVYMKKYFNTNHKMIDNSENLNIIMLSKAESDILHQYRVMFKKYFLLIVLYMLDGIHNHVFQKTVFFLMKEETAPGSLPLLEKTQKLWGALFCVLGTVLGLKYLPKTIEGLMGLIGLKLALNYCFLFCQSYEWRMLASIGAKPFIAVFWGLYAVNQLSVFNFALQNTEDRHKKTGGLIMAMIFFLTMILSYFLLAITIGEQ